MGGASAMGGNPGTSGGASGQGGQLAVGQGGSAMAPGGSEGSEVDGSGGQGSNGNKFFGIGCAFGPSQQHHSNAGLLGLAAIFLAYILRFRTRR